MPLVVGGAAAEAAAAALGHDVDRSACAAAVLRLEIRRLDLDFSDGVEPGRGIGAVARGACILVLDPVVRQVDAATAVDRDAAESIPARRFAVRSVDNARQEPERAQKVAALEADVLNLLRGDLRRPRARLRL